MKKTGASLAVLAITVAAVGGMLLAGNAAAERTARVEVCQVEIGRVEQVLAVNGMLRYAMEYAAISPQTGVVAQVYVQPGHHVQAGQPLFRLQEDVQAAAVSAALTAQGSYAEMLPVELPAMQLQEVKAGLDSLIVRAAADGVVQQVNIMENGGVMAGSAAVALSGMQQQIRCSVVLRDAERLKTGMQARIIKDGEVITMAQVREIGPAQVSSTTGQTVCQVSMEPQQNIALPLGAPLEAEIILYGQENVPVLPVEAVTEQRTVWWVADGRCYEIPADVVMEDEVSCWVNLPVGEKVICGGEPTGEGQRVKEIRR